MVKVDQGVWHFALLCSTVWNSSKSILCCAGLFAWNGFSESFVAFANRYWYLLLWKVPLLQESGKWSLCKQNKVGRCSHTVAAQAAPVSAVQTSMGTHLQGRQKRQVIIMNSYSFIRLFISWLHKSYTRSTISKERELDRKLHIGTMHSHDANL